jgi:hypothetical protein
MTAPLVRTDETRLLIEQLAWSVTRMGGATDPRIFKGGVFSLAATLRVPPWDIDWLAQVEALFYSFVTCINDLINLTDDQDGWLNSHGLPQLGDTAADAKAALDRSVAQTLTDLAGLTR